MFYLKSKLKLVLLQVLRIDDRLENTLKRVQSMNKNQFICRMSDQNKRREGRNGVTPYWSLSSDSCWSEPLFCRQIVSVIR